MTKEQKLGIIRVSKEKGFKMIETIEEFENELFVRYEAGDCDTYSYEDFAKEMNDKKICPSVISGFLECETREESARIQEKIYKLRKEIV